MTTALAILCLALCAVPVSGAAAPEQEKREQPLGRPGTPFVVGVGAHEGAAAIRGATRTTPLANRLLREHLERSEETPDEEDAMPQDPIEPAPPARAAQ